MAVENSLNSKRPRQELGDVRTAPRHCLHPRLRQKMTGQDDTVHENGWRERGAQRTGKESSAVGKARAGILRKHVSSLNVNCLRYLFFIPFSWESGPDVCHHFHEPRRLIRLLSLLKTSAAEHVLRNYVTDVRSTEMRRQVFWGVVPEAWVP